jgi:hypothetical protein
MYNLGENMGEMKYDLTTYNRDHQGAATATI